MPKSPNANDQQNDGKEMPDPLVNKEKKKKTPRKRKLKSMLNFDFSSDATKELQKREKERLERLDKNKKDFDIYKPMMAPSTSTMDAEVINAENDGETEDEEDILAMAAIDGEEHDEGNDDDLTIIDVESGNQEKGKIEYIEVSSEDENEHSLPGTSSSTAMPSFPFSTFHKRAELIQKPRFNAAAHWQFQHAQLQQYYYQNGLKNNQLAIKRMRRHSADYDTKEMTAEGRLLINAGKPDEDPDVFVAPYLTQVLQPHQIGGVKFMYDNVIETLQNFEKSDGNGCILAHSMGLGKTIQAITFIEIFIRTTSRNRVLIICPVNVLQNWNNEFEKWMPKEQIGDDHSIQIRDWEIFLFGDAIKTQEARVQLIDQWHRNGGVLLIGYEMFRLLIQQEKETGASGGRSGKKGSSKKQQQQEKRTVWDLEEGLAQLTGADRRQMAEQAEMKDTIKKALLSPGPDLVICDEGHRIKNLNTEVANALSAIYTKRRIVLTGYPLQNNLMEYYCMVEFVRPSYLGSKKDFLLMFEKPIRNGQCIDSTKRDMKLARQRIHVLTNLLRGFVQRRTQHLLKKILPESREYVLLLRKSPIQHALYRAFHHYVQAQELAGEASFNPLKGFAICMKIVNHPDMLYQAVLKKKKAQTTAPINDVGEEDKEKEENGKVENVPHQFCQSAPPSSIISANLNPSCWTNGQLTSANPSNQHFQNSPLQFYPNQPTPICQYGQQNGGQFHRQQQNQGRQQYFYSSMPHQMNPWNCQNGGGQRPPQMGQEANFGGNASFGGNFGWQNGQNQQFEGQNGQPLPKFPPQFPPPMPSNNQMPQGCVPPPTCLAPTRVPNYNFFQTQTPPNIHQQNQQQQFYSASNSTSHPPYLQAPSQSSAAPFYNIGNGPNTSSNLNCPTSPPATHQYEQRQFFNQQIGTNFDHARQLHATMSDEGIAADGNNNAASSRDIFKGTFLDDDDEQSSQQSISETNQASKNLTAKEGGNKQEKSQPNAVGGGGRNKATKEVNDLLSDEFLLEDASISFEWAEPSLIDYAPGILENSSKLFIANQIITETVRRGEKLLLFSQSVVTLNLIETFLKKQQIYGPPDWAYPIKFIKNKTYCRFDGTTIGSDREKLIKRFNEDPQLRLFLISTKAGSLGVNLVSANRVIIFDVSWNPCHDAQAICRIYRYGQKRKTFIYRLIMGNCMEKQVFNRQISKQGLQKRVIDEQMIDANVTTREVQNLMEYDEALDVISNEKTSTTMKMEENGTNKRENADEQNGYKFGLDDQLLADLLEANGKWFLETPFLHESMMLEREDGLSQEEKHEAELLYERERRGINFPPAAAGPDAQMHAEMEAMNRRMGFAPIAPSTSSSSSYSLPGDGDHRLTQTAPFPKNLELATEMHKMLQLQKLQHMEAMRTNRSRVVHQPQQPAMPNERGELAIQILKEVTLPKVNPGKEGDVPDYTLYPGQKMRMFTTRQGNNTYIRIVPENILLNATNVPASIGRFYKLMLDGVTVQQNASNSTNPNANEEIIQIDD